MTAADRTLEQFAEEKGIDAVVKLGEAASQMATFTAALAPLREEDRAELIGSLAAALRPDLPRDAA